MAATKEKLPDTHQSEREKQLAAKDKGTYEQLKGERGVWENHWEQIAEVMQPNSTGYNSTETPGRKKMQKVFDSTGIWALEELANLLHGNLVNPFQRWFQLKLDDRTKGKLRDVKVWVDELENAVYDVFSNPVSNFNSQSHALFLDLIAAGTGPLFIDKISEDPGVKFTAIPLRNVYLAEGGKGIIDVAYIRLLLTPRQVVQIYGADKVSPSMLVKADKAPFKRVEILHSIYPRTDRDKESKLNIDMEYASNHMELDTGWLLKESGFDFFPILAPRWTLRPGDTYGRCPAMTALPDVNLLNEQMRTDLRARQKIVDPTLMVPDDGILGPINTKPSSLIYFRAGLDKDSFIKPLETKGNIAVSNDGMEQTRERILRAFFLDRFKLQKEKVEMTRAEAEIRKQEDMQQLSPTIGRLETELLNPLIDLTIRILQESGRMPPPPEALDETDNISVEYVSAIARAQRSDEASALLRGVEVLTPFASVSPQIMDNFDMDVIARRTQEWFGIPEILFRSLEEVGEAREARAEQQQEMIDQQVAESEAKANRDNAAAGA